MVVEVGSYCFGYGIEVGDSMRGGGGGSNCKRYKRDYVAERQVRHSSSHCSQDGASDVKGKQSLSPLQYKNNKHTSTSFAAAISPHPYNRMKNKRKNTSAAPLLGQGLHIDKKNRLTLFMSNFKLPFKTNKRISAAGNDHCNNNTKTPKRAEKKDVVVEKKHVIETPITRKTSYEQLAKARAPLNHPPNSDIESDSYRSNALDVSDYSAQSIRFAVDFNGNQIDKCTRLTPLSFDGSADMNITNHFRSLDATGERRQDTVHSSTSPYYNTEGFSLQRCLTPSSYTPSFQSLDCDNMIAKDEVALSDRSGSFVPIPMILEQPLLLEEPLHSEDKGDCSSSLHYSTSNVSLPSITAEESNDIVMTSQESGPTTNKDRADDSAIAWGFLSAILSSPAPKSVLDNKKQKKREPVNLWQDGGDAEEKLETTIMFSLDTGSDDDAIPRVESHDSLPYLSGQSDVSDSNLIPIMNDENIPSQVQNDAADSTLAWTVLSAILSSPAPKSLLDNKKRRPVNLWQDNCKGHQVDDLDDIISLPTDHNDLVDECEPLNKYAEQDLANAPDNCSIPSVFCEADEDEDTIPDVDNPTEVSFPSLATPTKSSKDEADSTLAWTLLGAVLGSPAPCITKKRTTKEYVNLWKDDDEESSLLPEIDGLDIEVPILNLEDDLEDLEDGADNCSLPSISSEAHMNEDIIPDVDESILEVPLSLCEQVSSKQAADSTLAWTVLSAILGSPAPKSLLDNKKRAKEACVNLWEDDREESDQLPNMDDGDDLVDDLLTKFQALNLSTSEDVVDATDNFSIPSLSSEVQIEEEEEEDEDKEDTIPNVDDADDVEDVPFSPLTPSQSKDTADSTLAWTILSAVLGSPAPSSVTKKRTKKEHVNLWQDDDDESAVLPDMEEQHNEGTSSPKSVVGKLSSTDAVARNLFDDFNCARNDTMNTNTKSPTATVRRAIFTAKERIAAARNATMLLSSASLPNMTSNKDESSPKDITSPSRRSASNPNLSSSKRSIFSDEEKLCAASNCAFKRRDSITCKENSLASPEVTPRIDEDDDDFSMPSLSSTTDDDDSSSPRSYDNCLSSPPSSKEQAENVLAWSALGMLLGSPAPKVAKQKCNKKETAQNLWNDSNSVQDLVEIWEGRSS